MTDKIAQGSGAKNNSSFDEQIREQLGESFFQSYLTFMDGRPTSPSIDQDKNGDITKNEISRYLWKEDSAKRDRQIEDILGEDAYAAYEDLMEGRKNRPRVDTNKDGVQSKAEIDAFLATSAENKHPSDQLKKTMKAYEHMSDNFAIISEAKNDNWFGSDSGISDTDLKDAFKSKLSQSSDQITDRINRKIEGGAAGTRIESDTGRMIGLEHMGVEYCFSGDKSAPFSIFSDKTNEEFYLKVRDAGRKSQIEFWKAKNWLRLSEENP